MTETICHETHTLDSLPWLRASIMGANDGLLSTSSILMGVAGTNMSHHALLMTGVAGLVAGALAMATGEFVSVSSQADAEKSNIEKEKHELKHDWDGEVDELTAIYMERGLSPELSRTVALQLMEHDALGAHTRDELGLSEITEARPFQAAMASACAFSCGAIIPVIVALLSSDKMVSVFIFISTAIALILLGSVGAISGCTKPMKPAFRVLVWGIVAMTVTSCIGHLIS